jgi:hypothetical protein
MKLRLQAVALIIGFGLLAVAAVAFMVGTFWD